MSLTEVLEDDAVTDVREDSDHNNTKQTKCNARSSLSKPVLPVDIEDDIVDLYKNVPQVQDVFDVIDRIGSGTFSSVYLATLRNHPEIKEQFALKHLIPTSHPSRIESELKCLQQIGGSDYVMGVKACIREKDHVVIVMPYFPHDRFQDYVQSISAHEVRNYMKALLTALKKVHEQDIIHRDVKPSNFLYNRKTRQFALVDFGLAMKAPKPLKTDSTSHTQKDTSNSAVKDDSSRKRKLTQNDENTVVEPSRKRLSGESPPLHEKDMNIEKQTQSNSEPSVETKVLSPITPGIKKNNYMKTIKSPRRALLAKRALEMRQASLFEKSSDKNRTSLVQKTASGKPIGKTVKSLTCQCMSKAQICTVCIARSSQHAPRAGTQGFRSPEVLLKYPDQTTAVDVWSAGVIFMSLLSSRYPFFKAPDDITALAQIISIFGTLACADAARCIGKELICSPVMPTLNLRTMCESLRGLKPKPKQLPASEKNVKGGWYNIPDSAYDLLQKLLDLNPLTRITAEDALKHPFFDDL